MNNNDDLLGSIPDANLIEQLKQETKDLLWLSESEYPWSIFYFADAANFTPQTLLQQHNYPPETKIAIKQLTAFFSSAIIVEAWHNEDEQEEVTRYQDLVNLLSEKLTDIKVYLLGEVEIDVYVLGTTTKGAIAGIATKIVAT
ncbi:MAG: nuclease A inhibitor family protein [Cyanobacteria bacterium P01_G01_bin.39]